MPTATGCRRTWTTFATAKAMKSATEPAIAIATGSETWYVSPGGVEEQQGAEDERHRSRQRERAVAHHERLGRPEAGCEQHQQHAGPVDGQHLEPVEADDEADAAERGGEDQAGVVELDDDAEHARARA